MFRTLTTSRPVRLSPPPGSSACWPRAARATPPRPTALGLERRRPAPSATTTPRARRSPSASPPPRPTTAGWPPINNVRQGRGREVLGHRASRSPRAPTTPTCRSARSRPSSTTRSTPSCCCRSTAPRSPRSRPRRCRPASPSSTSTASSRRPFAARTTVLGDNYGMGVCAGTYICEHHRRQKLSNAVIAEIAGIDSLPLTQDRSKGFADALKACGQTVDNRVAAEFTVESGEKAASNLLQAAPKIDVLWNHDDDQGVGVLAALDNANRDEMLHRRRRLRERHARDQGRRRWRPRCSTRRPRPPTASASPACSVQGKGMSDLVQPSVPRRVVLDAPVVTKDNVDAVHAAGLRVLTHPRPWCSPVAPGRRARPTTTGPVGPSEGSSWPSTPPRPARLTTPCPCAPRDGSASAWSATPSWASPTPRPGATPAASSTRRCVPDLAAVARARRGGGRRHGSPLRLGSTSRPTGVR